MTVTQLIEALSKLPGNLDVKVYPLFGSSHSIDDVEEYQVLDHGIVVHTEVHLRI